MKPTLFSAATFDEARALCVGECNGYPMEERWNKESPLFASAILSHLPAGATTLLDYGCGPGRLVRPILKMRPELTVVGVDDAADMLRLAKIYVNNPNFKPVFPHQLDVQVDLACSIYTFQHVLAVDLRDTLARIHYFLKPEGRLIECSTPWRLAMRFDKIGYMDDTCMGVNLQEEIHRFFEPVGPLFSDEMLKEHEILRRIVKGESKDGKPAVYHRAVVYKRKEISQPYFNASPIW